MAVWSEVNIEKLEGSRRLDAEYYQPKYLEYAKKVSGGQVIGDVLESIMHPVEITRVYEDNGIQILLAQNIRGNQLDFSTRAFMPLSVEPAIRRNKLKVGDVVVTRSGANYGDTACYLGEPYEIYACADCLVLRPKQIDGRYLAAYLNSEIGRSLLKRGQYGAAQPHVAPTHIRNVRVPRLGTIEKVISSNVENAHGKSVESKGLYKQAECSLLEQLGLGDLNLSPDLFYERCYSQVRAAGRYDAEYFMPKYDRLVEAMENTRKACRLGEILHFCERGLQPEYDEEGKVAVVNTKHMGTQFLSGDYEHCRLDVWDRQKKAQLKQFDVLFYSTGAYIGRTNCWFDDVRAIGSNHVTIMRPNNRCNPVYLSLFLNSQAGLLQAYRHAHGSAQREVYTNDIRDFTIWLPSMKVQEKFAGTLLDARTARDESRRLLEQAKRMVEEAVHGGEGVHA